MNLYNETGEIYNKQTSLSWSPETGINDVSAYIQDDLATNRYQWRLLEHILLRLRKEVEEVDAKLVVMLLPVIFNPRDADTIAGGPFVQEFQTPSGSFTFRSAEPQDRLREISERTGIAVFDPTTDFIAFVRDNDLEAVWPDPHDRHFSDVGHKALADISRDILVEYLRVSIP